MAIPSKITALHHNPHLSRSLSLFDAIVYGVGVIVGAGIYALIGKGAGIAGNSIWLSFVFAGIVAAFTALSYAELSSMFPKTGAEFHFVKHAFNSDFLAFFTAYSGLFANVVSVPVVALAFAGYLNGLATVPITLAAAGLILFMSALNFSGIKESAKYTLVSTLLEVGGVVLIILLGIGLAGNVDLMQIPDGKNLFSSVFSAAALIFFAFVGFEQVANISEETKNSHKNIPKAVIISLIVATVLYILAAIASVSIVPWNELAKSGNPLALVAGTALGPHLQFVISIIALFATSNTVLILLIVASRIIYGVSKQGFMPDVFQKIHGQTKTPYLAVFIVMALSLVFLLLRDLEKVALLSNYFIFVMFLIVNASAIKFRITHPHTERPFRIPFSIANIPLTAILGVLSCIFLLLNINEPMTIFGVTLPLLFYGVIISLISVPVFFAVRAHNPAIK